MHDWFAVLRLEPARSKIPASVREVLGRLKDVQVDAASGIWAGAISIPEYPAFVEVCRLAGTWKGFHAEARGVPIEWRRHQKPLLCGRDRTLAELKGLGAVWCQGGPRESLVEPVEPYPTPCRQMFIGDRYETPWMFDCGKPAGGHGWELDRGFIRERARFLCATLELRVCPWFPFVDDAALEAWLESLPALIEAGPDSPYEVLDSILTLRPNSYGRRVRPEDRRRLDEFLKRFDEEDEG